MTRFDPKKNQKTPEEWSETALDVTRENNLQWNVIGGIILGAIAASAASPLTGGLVVVYCLWDAWKRASGIQRNQAAIIEVGCVGQVLDGDDFRSYAGQIGHEAIMAELTFAAQRDLPMSDAAADYFEDNYQQQPQVREVAPATKPSPQTALQSPATVLQSKVERNYYDPLANAKIDIIDEMSDRISNSLIVGVPGSGKGLLVSNSIRAAKCKHPSLRVFVIDPKADPKEAGYWDGCDVVKAYPCMDAKPSTVAAWAEAAFDEYAKYAQQHERILLILDEGTMLGNKLQQVKSKLLADNLTSVASGGDSSNRNIWVLIQSPYVGGAALTLSITSQLTSIVIASEQNIGAIAQWKSAKIFKQLSLDEVSGLIDSSETGRAIYYGKTGKWYMMPPLKNYSGYDRDNRKFLPGFEPKEDTEDSLKDEVEYLKDSQQVTRLELSENAQKIDAYFEAVKTKQPKTLRDMKKADRLAGLTDELLTDALTELVEAKRLVFDGDCSWSRPDW